jgi:succinate dehydrogenase hydrophobic anchor subunit
MEPSLTLRNPSLYVRLGSLNWLRQAVSGTAVFVLAGLHLTANHFIVAGGLRNFADVQAYLGHPAIRVLEALFLIVVSVHALLGVRSILLDFGLGTRLERRVTFVLAALGVATIVYGLWLMQVVLRL